MLHRLCTNAAVLACALLSAALGTAHAAGVCDPVLIPTQLDTKEEYQLQLAYLRTIQTEDALVRSRNAAGGGSYGGLSLSGSYDEFNSRRNAHLAAQNFELTVEQSRRVVTSFVPEHITKAWADCIARTSNGLTLYTKNVTKDGATLEIYWNPPPLVNVVELDMQVRGGAVDKEQLDRLRLWPTEMSRSLILDRKPDQEIRVAANLGGFTDDVVVLAHRDQPPPPPKQVVEFGACNPSPRASYSSYSGLRCGFNFGEVLRNSVDWAQENVVEYQFSVTGGGDYNLWIKYVNLDPQRAVRILVNGQEYYSHALGQVNGGGWHENNAKNVDYTTLGRIYLRVGENRIRIENRKDSAGKWSLFPHLYWFKIDPA